MSKLTPEVSSKIHDELIAFGNSILQKYDIKLMAVDFSWGLYGLCNPIEVVESVAIIVEQEVKENEISHYNSR